MSRIPRRAAVLGLSACLLVCATAPAADAVPRSFFGMQDWGAPSAGAFKRLAKAHVGVLRTDLTWSVVEPTPGTRNWSVFDRIVSRAGSTGVSVLPVVLSSPSFAASRSANPPMTDSARIAWGGFLIDAVKRYGPSGSFWQEHPLLPKRPIRSWQIWNEPNFPVYWNGHPNADQYKKLLALSRMAIKAVDPGAKIVLAGLPESKTGIPMAKYLEQLYRAGAKPLFDVVAVHPYARDFDGVLGAVIRARRVMKRGGDSTKPLRVTEIGWATGGKISARTKAFRTSLKGQAARLRRTYRTLVRVRRRYHLDGAYWFALHDRKRRPGERNWWGINTGLIRVSGRPKPAWRTFVRIARSAK